MWIFQQQHKHVQIRLIPIKFISDKSISILIWKKSNCLLNPINDLICDVISNNISNHIGNVPIICTHVLKSLFDNCCLAQFPGTFQKVPDEELVENMLRCVKNDDSCRKVRLPLRFILSYVRNTPYRKATKLYDVTVTPYQVLQQFNCLHNYYLHKHSFKDVPSNKFISNQASEIPHKLQRWQLDVPSGSWINEPQSKKLERFILRQPPPSFSYL